MMKRINNIKQIIITAAVALIFIAAVICAYIYNFNNNVSKTLINNMSELSLHDIKSIERYIDTNWENMNNIVERLSLHGCKTVEDVQERLNLERASSDFDTLYLLGDDGKAYDASYTITKADAFILQKLKDKSGRFVMRKDGKTIKQTESRQESLLYGTSVEHLKIGDVIFVGIVAQTNINSIQDYLKIDSFEGRGYSSVIDSDGNYIVNLDRSSSFGKQKNFLNKLEDGTFQDNMTVDLVRDKIAKKERFSISHLSSNGDARISTIIPMQNTDWSFVMSVSQDVFKEQSKNLMWMTAVMLIIVVLIVCAILLLLVRSEITSVKAKSETQARSEFLSNMSHEIRTPLNGLIGLNHLMTIYVDDKERLLEYIEKSGNTAQYLLSLVNDILDMSKLQSGHFQMEQETINLESMFDDLFSMQRENIESRGVRFEMNRDLKELYVVCDELRIKQVMMNVLSNAAKFTPKGGSICLTVNQKFVEVGKVITIIQVTDTGIGISRDFQKEIFNSFAQERNKNSESQKGTGLGMSISYLLMKQMGGSIRVESELGKGSTFTVEFPAEISDKPSVCDKEVQQTLPENSKKSREDLNILLAEDNDLNAEILLGILSAEGFQVECAKDGAEVVKMFEESTEGEYDVILMDVQMPIMDGYEATMKIRSLNRDDAKNVLIYACTANAFKEDQEKAFACGMNDFLAKPIDVNVLLQKVDACNRSDS